MRWLILAAAAISLSGCGLPPAVTYASYSADVLSYLTTGKSVTDHGISMVLEKDCALLRVFDGQICIEEVEKGIVARRLPRNSEARAVLPFGATDFAVTGHVGLVGPDTHNIEPSLRRAKVLSEALVARGIDPARINIANQVEVEPTVAIAGGLGELERYPAKWKPLTGVIMLRGKARFAWRCPDIGKGAQRRHGAKEPGLRWANRRLGCVAGVLAK